VFIATTRNDKRCTSCCRHDLLGLLATVRANVIGDGYDYRETVSPWLRSVLLLQPDARLMNGVPLDFKAHVLARSCCSRSGRSPGWSTRSARRWDTSPARTSCTAAGHRAWAARAVGWESPTSRTADPGHRG
jgi:hypothetical protein